MKWKTVVLIALVMLCGCRKTVEVEVTATPVVKSTVAVETKAAATAVPTSTKTALAPIGTSTQTPEQTKLQVTNTPIPTLPTVTQTPSPTVMVVRRWMVEVQVNGLPEKELSCLSFRFSNEAGKELVPANRQGNWYSFLEGPVWVQAVGSQDGTCPWSGYWLKGEQNPKRIQADVRTGQLVVVFDFRKK